MKITVWTTAKTLPELLIAWWVSNKSGRTNSLYIENPAWGNTVYLETLQEATIADWKAIIWWSSFAIAITDINDISLIAGTSQEVTILLS